MVGGGAWPGLTATTPAEMEDPLEERRRDEEEGIFAPP